MLVYRVAVSIGERSENVREYEKQIDNKLPMVTTSPLEGKGEEQIVMPHPASLRRVEK